MDETPRIPGLTGNQAPTRREHPRIPARMSAEVRIGEDHFTATTRDLSEGGVGLDCDRLVAEGTEVALGLFLVVDDVEDARFEPLWVKGRIAWSSETDDGHHHSAGVRFEVITDAQKQWLNRVVDALEKKSK